jgi:hypothetical protein
MANTENSCKDLVIEDHYSTSSDTLGDIMAVQKDTQITVYGYDFENMTLRDLMNYWHLNTHSFVDEIHEATDALGGIHDGSGNAIWKKWKKDYAKYESIKFSDLSNRDQIECKFEIVDMLHFFMNYAISIGMTAAELHNMFMSKNQENRRRISGGY